MVDGFRGADPTELRQLAQRCESASNRLRSLPPTLIASVNRARWAGPEVAQFFDGPMRSVSRSWSAASDELARMAQRLVHEADEQDRTSGEGGMIAAVLGGIEAATQPDVEMDLDTYRSITNRLRADIAALDRKGEFDGMSDEELKRLGDQLLWISGLQHAVAEVEPVPSTLVPPGGSDHSADWDGRAGILAVQLNYADDNDELTPKWNGDSTDAARYYDAKNDAIIDSVLARHRPGAWLTLTLEEMPDDDDHDQARRFAQALSRRIGAPVTYIRTDHSVIVTTGTMSNTHGVVVTGGIGLRGPDVDPSDRFKIHRRAALSADVQFAGGGDPYTVGFTAGHLGLADDNNRAWSTETIIDRARTWRSADGAPVHHIAGADYNDQDLRDRDRTIRLFGDEGGHLRLPAATVGDRSRIDRIEFIGMTPLVPDAEVVDLGRVEHGDVSMLKEGKNSGKVSDHRMVVGDFERPR